MRKKFTCYRCGKYVETEMDDNGDATCPACENVIELEPERRFQTRITSLEAENAALRERLAAYEVGFDPKVKLPKKGERVITFVNSKNWCFSDEDILSYLLKRNYLTDSTRWFPLPSAPEVENGK